MTALLSLLFTLLIVKLQTFPHTFMHLYAWKASIVNLSTA